MGLLIPCLVVLCVLTLVNRLLLSGAREARQADEASRAGAWAQTIACFFALVDNINFSLVIPDSYSLVVGLGGTPALSGAFVGVAKFGMAFGAFSIYALQRMRPHAWKVWGRPLWIVCAFADVLGAGSYFLICCFASGRWPAAADWQRRLLALLMVGRYLLGLGGGIRMMLARTLIAHINDVHHRPWHMARFVFSIMLGLGLGPIIASGVKTLDMQFCDVERRRYEAVGLVALVSTLYQLAMAACFPDLAAEEPGIVRGVSPPSDDASPRINAGKSKVVVRFCLAFALVRGLVISGVEVGTSMVLESEFGWEPRWIGAAEGCAFLFSVPLRLLYVRYGDWMSGVHWIRLFLLAAMLGCCLIFRIPGFLLDELGPRQREFVQVAALLTSDAVVFPCAFLSDGVNQGIMFQHMVPEGSRWLSINWVSLVQTFLVDGFARSIGPPLARGMMHRNRNFYACQQLLLLTLNVLLLSFGLRTPGDIEEEDGKEDRWANYAGDQEDEEAAQEKQAS